MDENCYVEPHNKAMASVAELQDARQVTLAVSGMGCPNCANRVHD